MTARNRRPSVAIVHDYLTQRGGAERVVLALAEALPGAPIYTSMYEPSLTFPEFAELDVRATGLNALAPLRRHHRFALPVLAPAFSRLRLRHDVVVCSSSGWAHAASTTGRKVVYCYTPSRWLYQTDRYLARFPPLLRSSFALAAAPLRSWDRAAAESADRYLVPSAEVRHRVLQAYGHEAEIVPLPAGLPRDGALTPLRGVEPGFVLCVSRLLAYKNVEPLVEAFRTLGDERLVLAGEGPLLAALRRVAPSNVVLAGRVSDAGLRWLYESCAALVAPSYEDYGLTPIEAAGYGKPAAALRFGGYLDTVDEGVTGVFFERAEPPEIADAVRRVLRGSWDSEAIVRHAGRFSRPAFVARIRQVVGEELELAGSPPSGRSNLAPTSGRAGLPPPGR